MAGYRLWRVKEVGDDLIIETFSVEHPITLWEAAEELQWILRLNGSPTLAPLKLKHSQDFLTRDMSRMLASVNDFLNPNGGPGFVEGLVPVLGNSLTASAHYNNGNYISAGIFGALTVLDAVGISALVAGSAKGLLRGTARELTLETIKRGRAFDSIDDALSGWRSNLAKKVPWEYGDLPRNIPGETDAFGKITIQRGLAGNALDETVLHESVHRFFSPTSGPFKELRGNLLEYGYNKSDFLRYTEEAIAEGFATGSIRKGLAFPLKNGYDVTITRVVAEAGGYIATVGGTSYAVYNWADQ